MGLIVRFQGGRRSGEVLQFDDGHERIVLGRDPVRCQIVFHADETQVGREHCALVRGLGRYRLAINQENLVLVDGEPAADGQELGPSVDMQLGPSGPKLVLETAHDKQLPSTAFQGRRPGQPTMIRSAGRAAQLGKRMALLAVLLLCAGAALGYWGWLRHDVDVKDTKGQVRKAQADLASTKSQVEKIVPSVTALTKLTEDQKKVLQNISTEVAAVDKRLKEVEPRLADAVQKASDSVYLVLLKDDDGQEYPKATAWVVDEKKGVLATNGHVAGRFPVPGTPTKMIVRSSTSPPRTFVVKSVYIHPGYDQFDRLWERFDPTTRVNPTTSIPIHPAGPACDVALLFLESSQGLGKALPLAPREELERMGPTYPVGYVGYPMEGLALEGANPKVPSPTRHLAYISSVTSYFGDAGAPKDELLLVQHALPCTGGASGSPIVNRDGQVVAVLNAGNVIGVAKHGRITSGVNVNFGQRADLVAELLDKSDERIQPRRLRKWEADIARHYKPRDTVEKEIKTVRDRIASRSLLTWRRQQTASDDYTLGGTRFLVHTTLTPITSAHWSRTLENDGPCILIAYEESDDASLQLGVEIAKDGKRKTYSGYRTDHDWSRVAQFDGRKEAKVTATVDSSRIGARVLLRGMQVVLNRIPVATRRDAILAHWTKGLKVPLGETVRPALVTENTGRLGKPVAEGLRSVNKIDVELKETGDYFVFLSTDTDEPLGLAVSRVGTHGLDKIVSSMRDGPTAYGSFKVSAEAKYTIFVTGKEAAVPYDLKIYRAVAAK